MTAPASATTEDAPFLHEALLYAGEDDFLARTSAFIHEGVAGREPVLVAVSARKIDRLSSMLGAEASLVRFADMAEVGSNPARIIPVWQDFATEADGRPFRGIGEPIWAERSAAELAESQRHEALLNLAFASTRRFRLLCPYDRASLGPHVLEEAERSHPFLREGATQRDSGRFRGTEILDGPFDEPLAAPPPDLPTMTFGPTTLGAVRRFVRTRARELGLGQDASADILLAANEIATNSIQHAGGIGTITMWRDHGLALCEVRDAGVIVEPLVGRRRPSIDQLRGRGLWLANQICDLVQIRSTDAGTTVRLTVRMR